MAVLMRQSIAHRWTAGHGFRQLLKGNGLPHQRLAYVQLLPAFSRLRPLESS